MPGVPDVLVIARSVVVGIAPCRGRDLKERAQMRALRLWIVLSLLATGMVRAAEAAPAARSATVSPITVRTEVYEQPPYIETTYFIYEKAGSIICTKMETCGKNGPCDKQYAAGILKQHDDVVAGSPSSTTGPVAIPAASLAKHVCLTKFGLIGTN